MATVKYVLFENDSDNSARHASSSNALGKAVVSIGTTVSFKLFFGG